MTTILLACAVVSPAAASMPELTPLPRARTDGACGEWAARQMEDALYLWGMQEDGTSSAGSATSRLRDKCRGFEIPEIVGFGSSAGFDEAYCHRHPAFRICSGRPGR